MAFNWNLVTQGLGAAASMIPGIGPFGGLITGTFQGLSDPFSMSDGGGSSVQNALDNAAKVQQAASFTSTGAEGAAANRESADAARKFIGQQTAEGRLASQQQQALGSTALGGAQATTDLARSATMMNLGNQNRNLMQQAAAAGGSPAALAGIASNLGQANTQTLNSLAQQGAAAQQAGLSQAGQAFAASEQVRNADLAQQLANFQPYALQKFGGTNVGAVGGFQQTQNAIQASEDPLALLKQMGGKGANLLQDQPYSEATINDMIQKALGKFGQKPLNPSTFYGPGF
jgi:hypothetical protein